jgi:dihydrofolate synthase / folylpolyglutamate synthase
VDVTTLLQRYDRFGINLGLSRIQRLLELLDNPQRNLPILHIAGTNGKGSVCAYLSSVLTAAGYRVGRYTSPHLVDWTERICLNEVPISSAELLRSLQHVESVIDHSQPSPTQFEVITAAAWWYFAQQQVEIAVIEVGLGGRLDATNVCDRPLVSVITSLSREHWQRLGPTLADIAGEKAGILKPGCPAVIGPLPSEAEAVVKQRILELGCVATWVEPAQLISKTITSKATEQNSTEFPRAVFAGIEYPLPLPGAFQLTNSALTIATVQILRSQGWEISDTAIEQGMRRTRWPGRLQWQNWQGQKLLIDGAHNTAAAWELRRYVDSLAIEPVAWLMGMLATKDHEDILKALLRPGDQLYLLPVPGHQSADPVIVADLASKVCPQLATCQTYPDLEIGLIALGQSGLNLKVLCGSLYLVGEFLKQST